MIILHFRRTDEVGSRFCGNIDRYDYHNPTAHALRVNYQHACTGYHEQGNIVTAMLHMFPGVIQLSSEGSAIVKGLMVLFSTDQ